MVVSNEDNTDDHLIGARSEIADLVALLGGGADGEGAAIEGAS